MTNSPVSWYNRDEPSKALWGLKVAVPVKVPDGKAGRALWRDLWSFHVPAKLLKMVFNGGKGDSMRGMVDLGFMPL